MNIVIFLYDGLTALDAIGPFQAFNSMPDANVRFVAKEAGIMRNGPTLPVLYAAHSISEVEECDILCIPGAGPAVYREVAKDEEVLNWIRKVHQTTKYTTTVCTGAIILAATGLLDGLKATTHWCFYDELASYGVEPVSDRVVQQGKIITSAGVSSGIDMALTVAALEYGANKSMEIQLRIEYDPQPPYDAGSPEKASDEVIEAVKDIYRDYLFVPETK